MSLRRLLVDVVGASSKDVVSLHVVGQTFHPQPGSLVIEGDGEVLRFVDSAALGIEREQNETRVLVDAVVGVALRSGTMKRLKDQEERDHG